MNRDYDHEFNFTMSQMLADLEKMYIEPLHEQFKKCNDFVSISQTVNDFTTENWPIMKQFILAKASMHESISTTELMHYMEDLELIDCECNVHFADYDPETVAVSLILITNTELRHSAKISLMFPFSRIITFFRIQSDQYEDENGKKYTEEMYCTNIEMTLKIKDDVWENLTPYIILHTLS